MVLTSPSSLSEQTTLWTVQVAEALSGGFEHDRATVRFCVSTAPGGGLAGLCCPGRPADGTPGHAGEQPGLAAEGPLPGGLGHL